MAITSATHTTVEEIRNRILEDQRRMLVASGVSRPGLAKGSERYIRAESVASVIMGVVAKEVALQDAQMPDSSLDDDLLRLCGIHGVEVSPGSGAVGNAIAEVSGRVIYLEGQEATSPDGVRYKVVATTVIDESYSEAASIVPIVGLDVGTKTDKPAGTVLTWTSPPSGSAPTAKVDIDGLRFGANADNNASLRVKLLEAIRHNALGGNSAGIAKSADDTSKAIQKSFVYPAAYGPCTCHVALVAPAVEAYQYTRVVPQALQLAAAASVIAEHPEHADFTITSVADYDVDLILRVTLPEPRDGGGLGGGWRDKSSIRWPAAVGSNTPPVVRLSATPTNGLAIRVYSESAPVAGAYVALWSSLYKKLARTRVLSSSSLGGGEYSLTLYTPIDVTWFAPAVGSWGDFVMPDADKLDKYASSIAGAFASLGPGEITSDAYRLPRAKRRPYVLEAYPSDLTSAHLGALSAAHPEVSNVIPHKAYISSTGAAITPIPPIACPVAPGVGSPPYALRLGRLAIYPA